MRPSSVRMAHLAPSSSASHLSAGLLASVGIRFSSPSSPSLSRALSAHNLFLLRRSWGSSGKMSLAITPVTPHTASELPPSRASGRRAPLSAAFMRIIPLPVRPVAVRQQGVIFAPRVVGGRWCHFGVERGGSGDPLRPAQLDGHPPLCDLRYGLKWDQQVLLCYPEETSGAHLQEEHLALLTVD